MGVCVWGVWCVCVGCGCAYFLVLGRNKNSISVVLCLQAISVVWCLQATSVVLCLQAISVVLWCGVFFSNNHNI